MKFAVVVHTQGTGSDGRVCTYDRTGFSSKPVHSREDARKAIERELELWSTDPYSDDCWAHHNNDDLSPTSDNTILYVEDTLGDEFTQREFFGGHTLLDFAGSGVTGGDAA